MNEILNRCIKILLLWRLAFVLSLIATAFLLVTYCVGSWSSLERAIIFIGVFVLGGLLFLLGYLKDRKKHGAKFIEKICSDSTEIINCICRGFG